MRRPALLTFLLFGILSLFTSLPPLHAAITWSGDVDPADPTTWSDTTVGYVGKTADGSITVASGSNLKSRIANLGLNDSVHGTATVSGSGSTWTNSGDLCVGHHGTGILDIQAGGIVSDTYGCLGMYYGSQGTATVTGSGSKWTNSSSLSVGSAGTGSLNIKSGGQVSNQNAFLGGASNGVGKVNVSGSGSKWKNSTDLYVGYEGTGTLRVEDGGLVTARTLFASLSDLFGDGTIDVKGAVLDAVLVFDSTTGAQPAIEFGMGGMLKLSPDLTSCLGAGYRGAGTLTIADGLAVDSSIGYLGYKSGSAGTATVTGSGTKWTISPLSSLYVGCCGTGTLNIKDGAEVSSSSGKLGSYTASSQGTATITGNGSKWTNSNNLYLGCDIGDCGPGDYRGTLNIQDGGQVSNSKAFLGEGMYSGCHGSATVTGSGSKWTNSDLYLGCVFTWGSAEGTGRLNIADGGEVVAASVSIYDKSLLSIDVGNESLLNIGSGGGAITNDGKVRIIAGAGAEAGKTYTPIVAQTWSGGGSYQALGGTWNSDHTFTASAVQSADADEQVTMDLSETQRVLIGDAATGWSVGASFLATDGPSELSFTATAVAGDDLTLGGGQNVLGAWLFDFSSGYAEGDPAYLSFDIGPGFSRDDLLIWHFDGSDWQQYAAADLTCNGQYASFTVTGFSGYAVTAVPEPTGLVLLIVGLLCLTGHSRRWWKKPNLRKLAMRNTERAKMLNRWRTTITHASESPKLKL